MTLVLCDRRLIVLGLAVAASLLELGPMAALLRQGEGLLALLVAGFAYQVGNAVPHPQRVIPIHFVAAVQVAAAALFALTTVGSPVWFCSIAAISWGLQLVRRQMTAVQGDDLPTTVQKRVARVLGFALAALLPIIGWLTVTLVALAVALVHARATTVMAPDTARGRWHPIEWTMFVHQMHYFAYAYAMPLLLAQKALGGLQLFGMWFACGWVSYLSAEMLWKRFPVRQTFLAGHIFLVALLALMSVVNSPWVTAMLWVLSGFGGGTVYCLKKLHSQNRLPHTRLDRAEDAGHLAGIAIPILAVYFLGWSAKLMPAMGSFWALVAVLIMAASFVFGSASRQLSGNQKEKAHADP